MLPMNGPNSYIITLYIACIVWSLHLYEFTMDICWIKIEITFLVQIYAAISFPVKKKKKNQLIFDRNQALKSTWGLGIIPLNMSFVPIILLRDVDIVIWGKDYMHDVRLDTSYWCHSTNYSSTENMANHISSMQKH